MEEQYCDVLVCGAGTAGACAAIAAGRMEAKTLVVEQLGFPGGSQTGSLVLPLMNCATPDEVLIRGINDEINARLEAHPGNQGRYFNYELLKYVLEEMLLEAGVEILYHTFVGDAVLCENRLTGVIGHNKSGSRLFRAAVTVDATGDADIACRAGVPYESGRPEDGMNQSASLRFVVGNVDYEALAARLVELDRVVEPPVFGMGFARGHTQAPKIEALIDQAIADGVLTADEGGYLQFFTIPGRPGEVAFNCPRILCINGARAEDLTRVQIEGRRIIPKIIEFCRRYLAGFEDAYLLHTAPLPGIRESRRIVGEYVLTAEDCMNPTRFSDRVAKSCYPIDIHNPSGVGVILKPLPPGQYHDIPYRTLVPLQVDNLLVAGRCVSSTFEAQSAIRIEPTCRALGQAAGTAAALCLQHRVTPRELDSELLLAKLAQQGANVS